MRRVGDSRRALAESAGVADQAYRTSAEFCALGNEATGEESE